MSSILDYMYSGDKKWDVFLSRESKKDYFKNLVRFVDSEFENKTIFPLKENVFNAFKYTPFDKIKVVIVGQDPYHEVNQAHGIAFSVLKGNKIPPSLLNIYKEIDREYGCGIPAHGYLESWAKQGVFMLNTVLTVREGFANSHKDKGWEIFTDEVLKEINKNDNPIVFMLWGSQAQNKEMFLNNKNHLILKTSHPSPLSVKRGFEGCNHFSIANMFLEENNEKPIDWRIT